jgi:hypothetical protein
MLKKIIIPLLAAASFSCVARRPELVPAAGPCFRSLTMKFSFRDGETRQNGRVLWRFDAGSSKFIFFNALNQSGLELDVAGEDAVLVNFSAKTFWKGDFSHLLDRIWGINLPLAAWRDLLLSGKVSQSLLAENGIEASMDGVAADGGPRNIRLRRDGAELALRVLKSGLRPGRIVLAEYAGRYRAAELEDVLEQ